MKYLGSIFLLFFLSSNTLAQNTYLEVFEKMGDKLGEATNVVIKADVAVKNEGSVIQSYEADLEKYGDSFYKKINDLETYFIKDQYVIIDHQESAVQYGQLKTSKKKEASLGFNGAQIEQLDSLIRNKIITATLISDQNNVMVFELSSPKSMIDKMVVHIKKKSWTVAKIVMHYASDNDYFDEVSVTYKTFQLHAPFKDLSRNAFFTISNNKIALSSKLNNYTQTKHDE